MPARKIVLISCTKSKLNKAAPAAQLYTSTLFQKSLNYARSLNPSAIYVLSAKYGLVGIDEVIAPYEFTLNKLSVRDVRKWSNNVLQQLADVTDLDRDHFIIFAGRLYYQYLLSGLKHADLPLEGLQLGQRLQWLSGDTPQMSGNTCAELHGLLVDRPRFHFPFNEDKLPSDGIYVLFERGEFAHDSDRIVRIGTHRGKGQLTGRLREHFLNENKDRSIFRKNIGRALLNKEQDPRIVQWELDLTSRKTRQENKAGVDNEFIVSVERRVSDYIHSKFSFAVIPVPDRSERMRLEAGLIATVAACPDCKPSEDWLGYFSPKQRIRESGLWLVQGLNAAPLDGLERKRLSELLGRIRDAHKAGSADRTGSRQQATRPAAKTPSKRDATYQPLLEYLVKTGKREVVLGFQELETILGRPLPKSARQYRPWWANQRDYRNRAQAKAWMEAGYLVDSVQLGDHGHVRFRKA